MTLVAPPETAVSPDSKAPRRWWKLALAVGIAALGVLVVIPLMVVVLVTSSGSSGCAPTVSSGTGGDDASPLTPSGPIGKPTRDGTTMMTSPFGQRWGTMHQGVDFAGPIGTPIYAALDGTVVKAGPAQGFGMWIVLDSIVDGKPVSTVYGHMYPNGVLVKEGQQVKVGDHIADIGNAGGSTGPHLHFEYWEGGRLQGGTAIDPMSKLGQAGSPQSSGSDSPTGTGAAVDCGFGTAGGDLRTGSVPPEFDPWIRKAGAVCPGVGAPLIASQLSAENGFRYGPSAPVSSTGALGPAQFMPGTWATWGKDYDGDGRADPNSIGDAVISQAHFMCAINGDITAAIAAGKVKGDPTALTIAAYNAGPAAVLAAGGMPSGGDYTTQTQPYVAKILAGQAQYTSEGSTGRFVPTGADGDNVVEAARQYLGTPYVWGGGDINGPSRGGFDCSGLTSFAYFAGKHITLPRTSEAQWGVGSEIPIDQAMPGDLVFGSFEANGPGHVGIYIGGGQMIHAPTTGDVVKQAPLMAGMKARRI